MIPYRKFFPFTVFLLFFSYSLSLAASSWQKGKMALVQYDGDVHFGDEETNRNNLTHLALEAIDHKADLIVFPEGSTLGYADSDELWCAGGRERYRDKQCRKVEEVAETIPEGKSTRYWAGLAQQYKVFIIFHLIEKGEGETVFYNTIGVVGPQGYVTKYRKRNLYWVDRAYASSGQGPTVLTTPFGKFGLMICMDGTFDGGLYDEYKGLGVRALILPMDWDQDPLGTGGAKRFFRQKARRHGMDIYASDVPAWDGTGKYPASGGARERSGLPDDAISLEGISYHELN